MIKFIQIILYKNGIVKGKGHELKLISRRDVEKDFNSHRHTQTDTDG